MAKDEILLNISDGVPITIRREGAEGFHILKSCTNCVVIKVTGSCLPTTVLKITWGYGERAVKRNGYRGTYYAQDMYFVPKVLSEEIIHVGDLSVSILEREYMEGVTALEAWDTLAQRDRLSIVAQIQDIMHKLANIRHFHHGYLQMESISTTSAVEYVNRRVILSKLFKQLEADQIMLSDHNDNNIRPSLCHGRLTLEHVILNDATVVGLVGWSKCDFVAEEVERSMYMFNDECDTRNSDLLTVLSTTSILSHEEDMAFRLYVFMYFYYLAKNKRTSRTWTQTRQRVYSMCSQIICDIDDSVASTVVADDSKGMWSDSTSQQQHQRNSNTNPFDLTEYEVGTFASTSYTDTSTGTWN